MNKKLYIIGAALLCGIAASAQTLNVNYGGATYNFNGANTGVMTYSNGGVEIMGRNFTLSALTNMKVVSDEAMADNLVLVDYSDAGAEVLVAGNVAQYVDVAVDGARVTISQSDAVADDTCGEITYRLAGTSSDGAFVLNGSYKASIELNGLTLTSLSGPAIDVQCGKRLAVRVTEGTVNTLCDAAGGSHKAALYCKGHMEFKQKGTLNVTGKTAHAISAKEYIEIKNTKINVLGAAKDGLNCNQYFFMESGTLTINNVADDGMQVSFKDDVDREAEDTGTITVKAGTLDISATADAAKAIKADGDIIVNGGTITASVSGGGVYDTVDKKVKAAACISADGIVEINGGTFNLTATGGGGKGISCDGKLTISAGTFTIATSGGLSAYSGGKINNNYTGNADNLSAANKASAKGIKCDSEIEINGGTFDISTKGLNAEGIESKKTLTINDGTIKIRAYDDGTNSTSHTYINGGDIEVISAKGDAIDANGNIYVNGGYMRIFGAASPECGFDAGDGYKTYFTGGTFLATAGGNSCPSTTAGSTQAYVVPSSVTFTAGTTVSIMLGTDTLATFEIPADYTSSSRGPGGWGGGGMGSGSSSTIISCPALVNGTTYTVKYGSSSTTASARLTGGTSGM